ncbi:phage holin family protein [Specibacter sp. RAF43]|uniref:phage holin family protein n=1 Tax=Specibacter sp. RAF43 TaxID=3233057 RepID=UPI003F952EEF
MAGALKNMHARTDNDPGTAGPTLIAALKTTSRLVPRQLTDEVELAKLELGEKKSRIGGVAVAAALALVFLTLLVIALVVAAIAGLAVVVPLWLSALLVSAALLLLMGLSALVAALKFKSLSPLAPVHAWRGLRHDLGILRAGRDFDPSTLTRPTLSKAEKKAKKAEAEAAKAKAKAEHEAKAAQNGPQATEEELIERTAVRREHLVSLREELLAQADVKKQAEQLIGQVRESAMGTVTTATDRAGTALQGAKERWKPLVVLAVSAAAFVVFLRKLFKK